MLLFGMTLAAALTAGEFPAVAGQHSGESPRTVVADFYAAYVPNRQGGLPGGAELQRIAPFLSRRLHGLIVAANAYVEGWVRRHPAEPAVDGLPPGELKPPFVDGDYFSSLFEGPKSFKVSRVVPGRKGSWNVYVRFWYEADAEGWEDAVIVIAERGHYKIDDVVYSGAGPFNPPGRLSRRLIQREAD
jgi:hypothetical protein